MQADVNNRTAELAQSDEETPDAAAIKTSQESLAREQSRIAELSRTLLQQVIDSQRPDSEPDVPPEEQP